MDGVKTTPLYEKHCALGAHMEAFGGFMMPIYYTRITDEHLWTRKSVALFDTAHMGIIMVDDPKLSLDRVVTVNCAKLTPGRCRYGFLLNDEGGVIDDIIVYRMDESRFMVVVNAATAENDLRHIQAHVDVDVKAAFAKDLVKTDIQGPLSRDALRCLCGEAVDDLKFFAHRPVTIFGKQCILSRTGYTGELGFEIYLPAQDLVRFWDELLALDIVKPAGLGARDSLRLEMGYPLYGHELDETVTPQEAGLRTFLDMSKEFIGKKALLDKEAAMSRRLVYFICEGRRIARHGHAIKAGGQVVGTVTSGTLSPALERPVGCGFVSVDASETGTALAIVNERGVEIPARVVDKPFCKNTSLLS